jgi:hypothetical protein
MQRSKRLVPLIVSLITVLACVVPGLSSPDADVISTSAAETVIAGLTQNVTETFTSTTAPTLTMTFTPTLIYLTPRFPSETPTETLLPGTETSTPEVTATFTPLPVEMRVTRPTHCRSGPGTSFEIVGSLLVGMTVPVVGRDPTSQYWYIPNPYVFTEYCWVWGEYAEFEGNQLLVPVVLPPATPTSTGTPVPTLEFKMSDRGKQTCNGAHWMNIDIMNLSEYPFKYIKIEMQDTTNNVYRSVTHNDFPHSNGCDKLIVVDMILGLGSSEIVSGPRFDYNLRGNRLMTSITVCTEEDAKGICTTREIKLNP